MLLTHHRKLFLHGWVAMGLLLLAIPQAMAQPTYTIINLGTVQPGDTASTGQGVSPDGSFITGFSSATGVGRALRWTQPGGTGIRLPPSRHPRRTQFPTGSQQRRCGRRLWLNNGILLQSPAGNLEKRFGDAAPAPAGQTLGRAYSVNTSEVAVGSVGGGSSEFATMYSGGAATILPQTMPNGGVLKTAYGINDLGRIVGQALDPTNAAVTKGFYVDPGDTVATDISTLSGHNSAIPFAVSSNGLIARIKFT